MLFIIFLLKYKCFKLLFFPSIIEPKNIERGERYPDFVLIFNSKISDLFPKSVSAKLLISKC